MSILDRLTDDELKNLLGKRNAEIADLMNQVQFWQANANYWKNVAMTKTSVIERLREDKTSLAAELYDLKASISLTQEQREALILALCTQGDTHEAEAQA